MSLPIAVIDTSSIITDRKALVDAADENLYVPYWSPAIIGELYRVLTIRQTEIHMGKGGLLDAAFKRQLSQQSKQMMLIISTLFEIADPKPPYPSSWLHNVDPDDIPIWAAAKLVGADYVVSCNHTDFPPGRKYKGIEYIMPAEFFRRIGYTQV
ncbi:PIN domain-containing protein [Cohnella candidum]|uniref:PIN domain-containing protein n=1 Tax=Cohnella candidum TaxID=2674991 RepID=A0A3G3K1W4_9BACL|nr:PIN domain-containing protein [Cohnella candidum]AYQ74458.1 PIN domain-containing protein [Cohnella candidum]